MSLVNDMLRDLDARRRDAPTRGLGAEKLVPAPNAAARRSRRRALIIGSGLVCAVVIAIAVVFLTGNGVSTGSLESVSLTTDTGSGSDDIEAPSNPVPSRAEVQTPTTEPVDETLSEITERLARLEQQNQELRAQASQQASVQIESPQEPAAGFAQQEADAPWQPTEWSAPAMTATASSENGSGARIDQPADQLATVPAPQASPELAASEVSTGNGSRSARALSFEDQDRQQVQLALEQWSSGQRLTALQTLDSFTYENAEAHRSRETLAKLLMQQGETQRALQVAELGLTIAPRFNGYRKIKARVLLGEGAADEAMVILSGNAPSVSADAEYHDLLATAYLSAQRYDNAVVSYQMLLQQDESVGRWWYGMATAFEGQGRIADAIGAYDRALRSGGLSVTLRQNSQQKLQALRQTAGLN
jgi:MSHA biogenesis protein MshN